MKTSFSFLLNDFMQYIFLPQNGNENNDQIVQIHSYPKKNILWSNWIFLFAWIPKE